MSTITEIEAAIEALPDKQVEELASWLQAFRQRRGNSVPAEEWLDRARGAASKGVTTEGVLALTRGDK